MMGEDIGVFEGAFKATKGLFNKYGPFRVFDTSISEGGFTGAAVGAALAGANGRYGVGRRRWIHVDV